MSAFSIRPMTAGDLDEVIAIAAALAAAPQWARGRYEEALDPDHAPHRIALVAAEPGSGAVIGFAVATVVSPEAELETIAVAAARQRSGVGLRLVNTLFEMLGRAGVTEVFLEVRESNAAAQSLYRRCGFAAAGRRSGYYDDSKEDAVIMRWARTDKEEPGLDEGCGAGRRVSLGELREGKPGD